MNQIAMKVRGALEQVSVDFADGVAAGGPRVRVADGEQLRLGVKGRHESVEVPGVVGLELGLDDRLGGVGRGVRSHRGSSAV